MKAWALAIVLAGALLALGSELPSVSAIPSCHTSNGSDVLDQDEQCDPGAAVPWGPITGCQDLGFSGGTLGCYAQGSGTQECHFDLSQCTDTLPAGACGNGIIEGGEECEFTSDRHPDGTAVAAFRPGTRCSAFATWTRGFLSCYASTDANPLLRCRARTSTCSPPNVPPSIAMHCPDVSLVHPGTPLAYVAKEGGVRPTDFGYTTTPDLVPCSDPDLDAVTPGLQPPTQTCAAGGTDCVYATEADQTGVPGGVGGRPLCVRPYLATGISYLYNARDQLIQCSTSNALCPKDFVYAASVPDPRTWPTPTTTEACVQTTCGNGVLDAGEQCDGALMGLISTCADLGYAGGAVSCTGCVFDLSACTDGTPGAAQCGNGVLDAGEDCDWNGNLENLTLFRDSLRCSTFNTWNRGGLRCIPQGNPGQCRADTSRCSTCTGPLCTSTDMKCSLPVIMNPGIDGAGTTSEWTVRADGSVPGDPTYDTAPPWTACDAPDMDGVTPGVQPPTQTCGPLDCVYADEAGTLNPGDNPTCYDPSSGNPADYTIPNAHNEPIRCSDQHAWCPQGFLYGQVNGTTEACLEENKICDWGSDADGYAHGCNTLSGIFQNRLWCLNNFDGDADPAPDPDGPPYQAVCCPFKFSLGGGFRLFFGNAVKVY